MGMCPRVVVGTCPKLVGLCPKLVGLCPKLVGLCPTNAGLCPSPGLCPTREWWGSKRGSTAAVWSWRSDIWLKFGHESWLTIDWALVLISEFGFSGMVVSEVKLDCFVPGTGWDCCCPWVVFTAEDTETEEVVVVVMGTTRGEGPATVDIIGPSCGFVVVLGTNLSTRSR